MHPTPTIAIVTAPSGAKKATAYSNSHTSSNGPVLYRIDHVEERRKTVWVTSLVPPAEWSADTIGQTFKVAEDSGLITNDKVESHRFSTGAEIGSLKMEMPVPDTTHGYAREKTVGRRASYQSYLRVSPATAPSSGQRSPTTPRSRILFYDKDDPYYGFTNFSAHPVRYKGRTYPTSEHLFQSFKFQGHRPDLAEHIRTASRRPAVAFSEARRFQPEVRRDWMSVNIQKMDETIWHKFTQHASLKAELLSTGDAELVEDSDKDAFWGIGADGRGRNELGKALERLRTKLRAEAGHSA